MPPPLELVRQNATKFLSKIEFSKTDNSTQEQNWFLGEVDLNHGLVALIGNKGSGKSALADVMALLGETRSHENFSFLRKDRFLSPKGKLGKLFRAKVTWESGATKERPLDEGPDLTAPERVKYIPQNYLETICSELKESTDTRFDQELKDVIFSHVAEADRLGKNTLEELIDYQTSETEDSILQIVKKLASLNEQIESLEEQTTADYRKKIQAQLEQRKAELEAHDAAKPTTVSKPELDPAAQAIASTASAKLADIQSRLDEIEKQLQAEKIKDSTETARIAATDRLLNRISNLERQFQTFLQDSVDDEEVLSIQLKEIVSLSIRNSSLD